MRRIERENAVKILYSWEISGGDIEETIELFSLVHNKNNGLNPFTLELVNGVVERLEVIDNMLKRNIEGWSINRLNKVDLAIFRVAIYELVFLTEETQIIINEALEITRALSDVGDEKAVKFNNKILDNIAKNEREK